ncbi:hypothetical protein LUX39_04190 [Actinomadura madurae]|nr:hypothetical protein [Actinomadura madurae]MCP9947695.1 hypothetical protein [Actinomadura madurae]MCQ0013133.1 hypothetical protein [Actinomadura madurae]
MPRLRPSRPAAHSATPSGENARRPGDGQHDPGAAEREPRPLAGGDPLPRQQRRQRRDHHRVQSLDERDDRGGQAHVHGGVEGAELDGLDQQPAHRHVRQRPAARPGRPDGDRERRQQQPRQPEPGEQQQQRRGRVHADDPGDERAAPQQHEHRRDGPHRPPAGDGRGRDGGVSRVVRGGRAGTGGPPPGVHPLDVHPPGVHLPGVHGHRTPLVTGQDGY